MSRFTIHLLNRDMSPSGDSKIKTDDSLQLCKEVMNLVDDGRCFIIYDEQTKESVLSFVQSVKKETTEYVRKFK